MNSADSWRTLWRNALPQYGVTIAQYLIPLMTLPYLTRVLGPEVYGQVVLLTAIMSYAQLTVAFGFDLSASIHISRLGGDKIAISRVVSAVLTARVFLAGLATGVMLAVSSLSPLMDGFEALAAGYFVSSILTASIPAFVFLGLECMPKLSSILILSRLAFALSVFVFVRGPEDVLWVPISSIFGSLIVLSYVTWFFARRLRLRLVLVRLSEVRSVTWDSASYFVDAVSSTLLGAFVVVYISSVGLSLEKVALWGASYQIIAAVQSLYVPITSSLLPRMAGGLDLVLLKRVLRLCLPLVVLGSLILLVFAEPVMGVLYGERFSDGSILRSLVPLLMVSFFVLLSGAPVLGVLGKQRFIATSTFISGVCFLGSLIVLWSVGPVTLVTVGLLRVGAECVLLAIRLWHVRGSMQGSEADQDE